MSSRNLATPNVVFNEQSLVKALSAVVGSFVSSSLFYPLNVARLKLQCNPNVAGNMKQGLLSNFAFLKALSTFTSIALCKYYTGEGVVV